MTNTDYSPGNKKKSRIRSLIYRIFLIVIAGLTAGLSFYSWNASRVVGNQLPMPFGFGASVVLSGSMEPSLKVNDLVFVIETDDYQVDDIVVYQNSSELIIHRIVSVDGDQVITKGDANPVSDDPIRMDAIKGRYSFRLPYIGLLFRFIKTLPGTLLILALIVYLMYRSRKKERRNGEKELDQIAEEIRLLRQKQLADASSDVERSEADSGSEDTSSGEATKTPASEQEPVPRTEKDIERNAPTDEEKSKNVVNSQLSEITDIINKMDV